MTKRRLVGEHSFRGFENGMHDNGLTRTDLAKQTANGLYSLRTLAFAHTFEFQKTGEYITDNLRILLRKMIETKEVELSEYIDHGRRGFAVTKPLFEKLLQRYRVNTN